jgi:hypothetical protein
MQKMFNNDVLTVIFDYQDNINFLKSRQICKNYLNVIDNIKFTLKIYKIRNHNIPKLSNFVSKNVFIDINLNYCHNVPNKITKLNNVIILNINNNDYITDNKLTKLTALKVLNFDCAFIGTISPLNLKKTTDKGIKNLINLVWLDLSCNKYITDEGIKMLTNLTKLNISSNEIITDGGIKELTNLIHLNLCFTEQVTDYGLKKLTNLKYLSLQTNTNITAKSLKLLTKLTWLNLCNNHIIDEKIVELTNLTFLDLRHCTTIFDEILGIT